MSGDLFTECFPTDLVGSLVEPVLRVAALHVVTDQGAGLGVPWLQLQPHHLLPTAVRGSPGRTRQLQL